MRSFASWARLLAAAGALPLTLLAAACGTGSAAPASATVSGSPASGPAAAYWRTYHLNAARTGNDGKEPSFAHLVPAWTAQPVDGAMYAEPLINGTNVIVATENDSLYAFTAGSGQQRWHVKVGTARTSNFPCGNIMPLGITGTPVIDGGYLYAVAEIEQPAGTYQFHLVKLNPSSGTVIYNRDITPSGFDANTQQQRSALAVSNGNVVIAWGGLDGDCGSYHGYVETVAEATGAEVAQWNDTSGDNEGGIWGPSGPAVDGSGNIYVTTGNGTSTNVNSYDLGDSVVKLSSSLSLLSFFAPGPPQAWTSLNASDTDLASIGPSLLSNGLLFAIGKGGRGYLLNQSQLPSNSNPGGGENAGAQVCTLTGFAAFSGMATAGSLVYVPCKDGIAAVKIDSSTSFHRVWYTKSGGSAPIVAGGLVWTLKMFGGTAVYGLNPSTGALAATLALPATTMHFATPTSGGGQLYVGAGSVLIAFKPSGT